MRKKLGPGTIAMNEDDRVSIPSELDSNLWAEIPKYQAMKHEQEIRKEKENFLKKKTLNRKNLQS